MDDTNRKTSNKYIMIFLRKCFKYKFSSLPPLRTCIVIIFPAYVYPSDVDIMSISFSFDTITISIPSRGIYDETIFRKNK